MIPAKVSIRKINELMYENYGRLEDPNVNTIILDLNSTFNTICSIDRNSLAEYGSTEYIKQIGSLLQAFIKKNLDKQIIVLYNKEKTYLKEHLGKNYLEFFYENRPTLANKIIEHYIKILEVITKKTDVTVINCKKIEPSVIIMQYLITKGSNVLILSRSRLCLQLISEGGYYWDGTFLYNKKIPYNKIISYVNPKAKTKFPKELAYGLYPYFLCMRGIPSHKFTGVVGYGDKRTIKYLEENMVNIMKIEDTIFNYDDANYTIPLCFMRTIMKNNKNIQDEFDTVVAQL